MIDRVPQVLGCGGSFFPRRAEIGQQVLGRGEPRRAQPPSRPPPVTVLSKHGIELTNRVSDVRRGNPWKIDEVRSVRRKNCEADRSAQVEIAPDWSTDPRWICGLVLIAPIAQMPVKPIGEGGDIFG